MKFKNSFFIFLFLFLFLNFSIVSAYVDQNAIIPNFDFHYYDAGSCVHLDNYFTEADYYCMDFYYAGVNHYYCSDRDDFATYSWVKYEGYFNISLGYQDKGDFYTCNEANTTNCVNAFCVNRYPLDATGQILPYMISPMLIEAWDNEGEMVGQYITVAGENSTTEPESAFNPTLHPTLIRPFEDLTLAENDPVKTFFINSKITDYNYIEVTWYDQSTNRSRSLSATKTSPKSCHGDYFPTQVSMSICIEGRGSDVALEFTHTGYENTTVNVTIYAYNDYGFVYDTFEVETMGNIYLEGQDNLLDAEGEYTGESFMGYFTTLILRIFPSDSILTTPQRFAFVLIGFLVVNLLLIFGLNRFSLSGGVMGMLLVTLNIVTTFFFFAIGYLPVSLLVVAFLILIALAFFRIKAGG